MNLQGLNAWRERAKFIRQPNHAFINGLFAAARDGQTFASINPANGLKLTDAACQANDIDLAVSAARRAFKSGVWSQTHSRARKKVLLRLAARIDPHSELETTWINLGC